jgi:RNA polymerase sigma-70 factor (ECF subfamily)
MPLQPAVDDLRLTRPPHGSKDERMASTPPNRPVFTQADVDFVRSALAKMGVSKGLDDAVGDVLLQVTEKLDDYDPERRLRPWLSGFARLGALSHLRKVRTLAHRERCVGDVEELDVPSSAADPHTATLTRRKAELFYALFEKLPPEQAEVLLLYEGTSLTIEDVARALRIPAGTAKTRLAAARKHLDAELSRLRAQGEPLSVVPLWVLSEMFPGATEGPASAPGISLHPKPGTAASWLGPMLGAAAIGASVAAGSMTLQKCDRHAPPDPAIVAAAVLERAPAPSSPPGTALSAREPEAQAPTPEASAIPKPGPASRPAHASTPPDFAVDEAQAQLFAARTAFAHGDAAGALVVLEQLDRRDRRGSFWTARELLRIEVLVRLGREAEARRRADILQRKTREGATLKRLHVILNAAR